MARIIHTEIVHKNNYGLTVKEEQIPDLQTGKSTSYTVIERQDGAIIIPIVLHQGKQQPSAEHQVLLLQQHRHPTDQNNWELPMGGQEIDETSEAAAVRELREETGITDAKLIKIGTFHPLPALLRQSATVFVAQVTATQLQHALDQNISEDILTRQVVTLRMFDNLLKAGEISDGFTISAFYFLELWLKNDSA